jgi:hypothetical protein
MNVHTPLREKHNNPVSNYHIKENLNGLGSPPNKFEKTLEKYKS